MKPGTRLLLAVLLGIAVLTAGTGAAAAYVWHSTGTIRLCVHETQDGGSDLSLRFPGALLDAAISLCPLPERWRGVGLDADLTGLAPLLHTVSEEIGRMPDAVLVDVRSGCERVKIAKSGDAITVRVVSSGEKIEIDLPVRTFRLVLEKLGSAAARAVRA